MLVLGIDEAGRGPVVGSMMIAGVLIEESDQKKLKKMGIKDSKLLSKKQREEFREKIENLAVEIHHIEITAKDIDEKRKRMSLNELEALKMAELIEMFMGKPDKTIIDLPDPTSEGFKRRIRKYTNLYGEVIAEHKADISYPVVSAASIIAKTERDRHVKQLEKLFNVKLASGYQHDPGTIKFLEEHKGEMPDFIRKSWDTYRKLQDKKYQKKLV
jgi:ribonuclease HII